MTEKIISKEWVEFCRSAIAAHLQKKALGANGPKPQEVCNLNDLNPTGVFVTLWTDRGALRGCIGRHARAFPGAIDEELADCAIAAATEDPRFRSVQLEELPLLGLEISLLGSPEKVEETQSLDPHRWGVIVRAGNKGATLLPEIEGIDTVEEQLNAVKRKAGIGPKEEVQIFRFKVTKVIGPGA